jgi:prevent-host-death family protein
MNLDNINFYSIAQAKAKFSEMIEKSQKSDIIITKNGKPESMIVNYEKYNNMLKFIEEIKDLSLLEIDDLEEYKNYKKFFKDFDL